MKPFSRHMERHRTDRIGWLRAAVLGANDGIVSTASLVLGVAAAGANEHAILVAGGAGLMAGRCRWRWVNMSRFILKPIPKMPNWSVNALKLNPILLRNMQN